ncbi:hypothetical protein LTR27_003899 [Elasticomyces elasticus]|nr:hypothetical protein LTR27_003899 [Elasticomyces elasticus]
MRWGPNPLDPETFAEGDKGESRCEEALGSFAPIHCPRLALLDYDASPVHPQPPADLRDVQERKEVPPAKVWQNALGSTPLNRPEAERR